MKNRIIKYLKSRKTHFISIFVYMAIIYITWIIVQNLPVLKKDEEVTKYFNPINVTVDCVREDVIVETTVKNTEIELLNDTIGFYLPNGKYQEITLSHLSEDYRVKKGDRIIVYTFDDQTYHYHDINRVYYLKYLILLFVLLVVIIGGFIGVKSLLSLGFSCMILIFALIPLLEKGYNPILTLSGIGFLVISSSLFFTYGFCRKSVIALLGTSIGLALSSLLSWIYIDLLRLTGIQNEIDSFLINNSTTDFDMKGLLLGSIMLGTLGVIDDVTISQVITVEELSRNSKKSSLRELFFSAMRVGRSHIASMVNTLFLAYFSVSLSLILVISIQNWDMNLLLNKRFIAAELVRTLVGSIGLVVSVPVTTYLACLSSENFNTKRTRALISNSFKKK